jgi:hypothetical protein
MPAMGMLQCSGPSLIWKHMTRKVSRSALWVLDIFCSPQVIGIRLYRNNGALT